MKKIVFLLSVLAVVSCKKDEPKKEPLYPKSAYEAESNMENNSTAANTKAPEELGKEIFNGKGNCAACHKLDEKLVGPSVQEIAKIYKAKNSDIVNFLKGNGTPIVDPSQYEIMKANFAVTSAMSDEELQGLEAYFYANLK